VPLCLRLGTTVTRPSTFALIPVLFLLKEQHTTCPNVAGSRSPCSPHCQKIREQSRLGAFDVEGDLARRKYPPAEGRLAGANVPLI
jgi:hypothetical protein